MKYRKLRIAWSVGWGVACLLLIALWVRSYTHFDSLGVRVSLNRLIVINSLFGRCEISQYPIQSLLPRWRYWHKDASVLDAQGYGHGPNPPSRIWGFFDFSQGSQGIVIPYWYLLAITASIATIPWFHLSNRFSLRTLLIVTTLVAVVLGAVVYPVR